MEIHQFIAIQICLPDWDFDKVLSHARLKGHVGKCLDLNLNSKAAAQTVSSLGNNCAWKSKELILKIKTSSITKQQSSHPEVK